MIIKSKFALIARCLMSLIGLLASTENLVPHPSMALFHWVIQKIPKCLIILIAPYWLGLPWCWNLVQLSMEIPLQLSLSTTLIKHSHNQVFHNNPPHLNLHQAHRSKNKTSLWKTERIATPQRPSTRTVNKSKWALFLKNCAERIQWTSPHPLWNKSQICLDATGL